MNPKPTGRLRGNDLVLSRTFRAPIGDVWTSLTSSESTARWFGPWERTSDDKKIRVQMAFEEGKSRGSSAQSSSAKRRITSPSGRRAGTAKSSSR